MECFHTAAHIQKNTQIHMGPIIKFVGLHFAPPYAYHDRECVTPKSYIISPSLALDGMRFPLLHVHSKQCGWGVGFLALLSNLNSLLEICYLRFYSREKRIYMYHFSYISSRAFIETNKLNFYF